MGKHLIKFAIIAPVAQLDRVPDYESGGRGFESSPVRHKNLTVILYLFMSSQLIFSVKDALVRYKDCLLYTSDAADEEDV